LVALWVGVIPALSTGLVLRYLVPHAGAGTAGVIVFLAQRLGPYFAVALFFLFAALARYWRCRLPGGRYASSLPAHLVSGELDGEQLAFWGRAAAFYERMRTTGMRRKLAAALAGDKVTCICERLVDLRRGLEDGDAARTREAIGAVESIAAPVLGRRRRLDAMVSLAIAVGTVCAVLALRALVAQPYRVQSASMLPTLEPDDCIAGNKLAYMAGNGPRRGDVVVFRSAAVALDAQISHLPDLLVKRVIGLPGDRVAMRGSVPIVNGWEVPHCDAGEYIYMMPDASGNSLHGRLRVEFIDDGAYLTVAASAIPFPEAYVVKPGEVFVLGDNRGNSLDSRSYAKAAGGGVPLDAIQARAQWYLTGTHRSGDVDLGRLLRPIDSLQARLRLEGIDVHPLEGAIGKCLQNRPKDTRVPSPGQTSVARGSGT
jgi:signal peptidase I